MATGALVGVTTGVMKPLLSKLSKLLEQEYSKVKGVRKQIRFFRDELSAMSATLQMLADAEQLDPETRDWRDKLRELSYDLEDCIDAFMSRVDHEHDKGAGFMQFFHKLKRLKARHEIADQIEELKASVIEASERHRRYRSGEISSKSSNYCCAVDPRLPTLYTEIDKLVGIDGPKKHIMEWLIMETKASSSELKVLSIVGCGGLGKTTLANQVYQDVKTQFECAAFVSVSRNPDVKNILRDIARGFGITDNMLDDDEKQLIDKLREHLQYKRYLVVIDDVWDVRPWETIKLALVNKNFESRVITTTRSNVVASCLSSKGSNVYQMKSLDVEDSKRLLFKRAFGPENLCSAHLGSVPDQILRKCDGLPLAIITISSLLADQHAKSEWDRVLNDIGSALSKNPGAENMTTILSMSYFDIPHHLKTCLLYLSVFPEDHEIKKQCLINRWIAEGFIQEEVGQTTYETGEGYFNDLINRSMIQPVDVKYGQAKACRVHDIILDYIKCKAYDENFVTTLDVAEPIYTSQYKVRRLCVSNHNEDNVTIWANPLLTQVRLVTIFGQPVKTTLLPSTALRVLDLGDCSGMSDHHLVNIENLVHLKYLRLRSRSINKLPETIGELQQLQTLDVRGTSIEELPFTITKLQQLAHLYVDWDVRFPDGMIGQMLSLEVLKQYGLLYYDQVQSLQEFSKQIKLRTLKIRWYFDLLDGLEGRSQAEAIHSYVGNLLSSCNLHDLYITNFPKEYPLLLDSWHPTASCCLRKLCMAGCLVYKVPNWMGSLGNLRVLELEMICVRPEDIDILGAIPSLLFLKVGTAGGTNGRIIVHGNNRFRSLKYFSLHINWCGTSLEFEVGSMPKLEHVKLEFCVHEMECLNGASSLGIQHLSALRKVEIIIRSNHRNDRNYNPGEENDNDAARRVSRAINIALVTLPNRPDIKFNILNGWLCQQFECDETDEEEEEEQTNEEEETEEEVAWQVDSGCSSQNVISFCKRYD